MQKEKTVAEGKNTEKSKAVEIKIEEEETSEKGNKREEEKTESNAGIVQIQNIELILDEEIEKEKPIEEQENMVQEQKSRERKGKQQAQSNKQTTPTW